MASRPAMLRQSFTFRLSLLYLGLFIVSSYLLFGFIYYTNTRSLEQQFSAALDTESKLFTERYQQFGLNGVIRLLAFRAQNQTDLAVYALTDTNNDILAGTIDKWPDLPAGDQSTEVRLTFDDGGPTQVIGAKISRLDDQHKLLIGRSKEPIKRLQRRLINTFFSAAIVTLFLGLFGGLWLSKRAVRRIENINTLVNTTIQGDLTQRLELGEPVDDLDQLSHNINLMLDRIQSLMSDVSGVANNIAHDLRTPLSHLRLQLEQIQDSKLSAKATRQKIGQAIDSADQLLDTFNALLRISKIESTKHRESFRTVHIADLVRDVIELYEPLAEDKQQLLSATELDNVVIKADRNLVFQALSNLVDNAIKHTPADTAITIRSAVLEEHIQLSVCDEGGGVKADELRHLTRRFYRTDKSRTTQGNGLGLSLVAAIMTLHLGEIIFSDNQPGLCVALRFVRPQS